MSISKNYKLNSTESNSTESNFTQSNYYKQYPRDKTYIIIISIVCVIAMAFLIYLLVSDNYHENYVGVYNIKNSLIENFDKIFVNHEIKENCLKDIINLEIKPIKCKDKIKPIRLEGNKIYVCDKKSNKSKNTKQRINYDFLLLMVDFILKYTDKSKSEQIKNKLLHWAYLNHFISKNHAKTV
jgi:hypothetical protein